MMHDLLVLLSFALTASCAQPSAPQPKGSPPLRDLPWGDLNFIHTTDTHGWHGGHLQEPNYSADWGDYISFAKHMRDRADRDGTDVLVIDSGDRVEGNGLYDGSEPKGLYTFDIFKHQGIDVLCSGNHELYKANTSDNEFETTVPDFRGNYLASNLDIHDHQNGKLVPLAPRYKKFTTKNRGYRVMAFGFLFNFQGSSNNTVVTPVEDAIKQDWFQDAIRDRDIDIFVVVGHIGLRMKEIKMIFKAIRETQWDAPIHFFGGHTHIRDYAKYDSMAYGIESGRYLETIGFASVTLPGSGKNEQGTARRSSPKFQRRYIDNNLYSYYHHTGLNETTFPTELGKNVTAQIADARKAMKLDSVHGCAPKDLWLNKAEITDESSMFYWLGQQVLPDQFTEHKENARPKLVLTNTGAMRFDLFKGPFTRDTTFVIAPFTSGFRSFRDVKFSKASRLIEVLNNAGNLLQSLDPTLDPTLIMPPRPASLESAFPSNVDELLADSRPQAPLRDLKDKDDTTPGYTTHDDAGNDGDDTVHSRIQFYKVPNVIQTAVDFPVSEQPETVDVVYNDFIEPWLILAFHFLGEKFDGEDAVPALDGKSMTQIIADWVEENWPCKEVEGVFDEL